MESTKVMLVDDEEAFVQTMEKRITRRGLSVVTASSGRKALEVIKRSKDLDVVILDVKMPEMDGIETLKRIKSDYPLVEVVMLTGHATVESAIEGMKLGAFDYLMKPSDLDLLLAKVKEAHDKKKAHEQKIIEAQLKEITSRRA